MVYTKKFRLHFHLASWNDRPSNQFNALFSKPPAAVGGFAYIRVMIL